MGWFSKVFKTVGKMFGLSGDEDLAKTQKKQLQQLEEQNKLNSANEADRVTQFEDTSVTAGGDYGGNDTRRKKRDTGGYSSNIGLSI